LKRAILAAMDPATLIVHVWLADLGVLEEPGPAVRRRVNGAHPASEAARRSLWSEEDSVYAELACASPHEVDEAVAAVYWRYFRLPHIERLYGLPAGDARLTDYTRKLLGLPPQTSSEDAEAAAHARALELEREWYARQASKGRRHSA